ncbi:MAG: glycerol-3-phosphate acyltransferase [Dehalococcoidales bacterium]|nr:glycerol-3-phosphate acyltransferase [Dehalococcoidales bacterium]
MNPGAGNPWLVLIAAVSYLIGSIPTAYFATKGMVGRDIRLEGSHKIGAMNAYGLIQGLRSPKQAALGLVAILLVDLGKGLLTIYLARWLLFLGYQPAPALIIAGFFTILGHNYPFCFKFKDGGTGFASFLGILLALNPYALGVWGGTMLFTIFAAEHVTKGRWRPDSIRKIIAVIGTQIPGRLVGMGVSLVTVYLLDPGLLFPVLGPTVLVYIKHADSLKALVRKPRKPQE